MNVHITKIKETTEQHANGALSDEDWNIISDAVETLEVWTEQQFLDDKGCRPMWSPTLRRLRNLLATRANRPASYTLEQIEAALAAKEREWWVRIGKFRKALDAAGLHGHYNLLQEHFQDESGKWEAKESEIEQLKAQATIEILNMQKGNKL